jgi:hypothetical protein
MSDGCPSEELFSYIVAFNKLPLIYALAAKQERKACFSTRF